MNREKLTWRERASGSNFIASVWSCRVSETTTRSVLADPCISISLIKEDGNTKVVLRGPETEPRSEFLASGYICVSIRLQPGVSLLGFPVQKFIDDSLTLPVDNMSHFWFEGVQLQLPDFDHAELLIDQLVALGYINYEAADRKDIQTAPAVSARTHARFIKRTTGFSPYRLCRLQRAHLALSLLKQDTPLTTVAAELDFVDQSHLTHTLKQFLGYTPKQLVHLPQLPYDVQNLQY